MKFYSRKNTLDYPVSVSPMGEIAGHPVGPGMFDVNGAMALQCGVNFTVHTHFGTSCELLLFHRGEEEPYAVLPFPDAYKIGDVYSMIVFGLNIEDFEYITSSPQNDWFWYNQFFDLCVNNYYSLEEVNKNFYGNLYLLGVGIRIICDNIPVKYGQIKNGVEIPIQNVDIVEHNIK